MGPRDPLLNLLLFFFVVAISVAGTLLFERWRERRRERQLEQVLSQFSPPIPTNLQLEGGAAEGLRLLAEGYRKSGEYQQSIYIYHWLYRQLKRPDYLLGLGRVYLEAGFLKKGEETLLHLLQRYPRYREGLRLLAQIEERLGNWEMVRDILESLEILGGEEREIGYLLWVLYRNGEYREEERRRYGGIEEVVERFPFLKRSYLRHLFGVNPEEGYRQVAPSPLEYLDLYFHRTDIPDLPQFRLVKQIKKELPPPPQIPPETPFPLRVLLLLPAGEAQLRILYRCQNCLRKFPFYLERCPKCGSLFLFKPILKVEPPPVIGKMNLEI